jgi:hypothetical protein
VTNFLFWNVNGNSLEERVARIVRSRDVDVVALAECDATSPRWLDAISDAQHCRYHTGTTLLESIAVYTRFGHRTVQEDPRTRVSARQLYLPSGRDLLLVVAHLPSKLFWQSDSQSQLCTDFAAQIRRMERLLGHARTVLVGDLNMNPFEPGVVSSHGLHATMARSVAERGTRTVLGREYGFFYNPMWGHFGDALDGPPGTYYDSRSEAVTYFWNVFDQVLVRPSLLGVFDTGSVRILDSDDSGSLLSRTGLPQKSHASDHLPILFSLDM